MPRLGYSILLGLVGAGIVHIAIVLLLPLFSERDAWTRLAAASDLYEIVKLGAFSEKDGVAEPVDPLFNARACRFDLTDGIVHVRAPGIAPFWSASIYNRSGQNIYSFNDRTAAGSVLDFVVVTPIQVIEVRKDLPVELESSIFVEANVDEGIVVVRAFVPDDSWAPAVSTYLDGITCSLE